MYNHEQGQINMLSNLGRMLEAASRANAAKTTGKSEEGQGLV